MSFTRENRLVGYSNIAPGQPSGVENHLGAGLGPVTSKTYNIAVGQAEPRNKENMTRGVAPPTWHT